MTKYDFRLILDGADIATLQSVDALYEAGCDDALFGATAGVQFGGFSREAPSLAEAVFSAIRQVEAAVPGLRVVRVEPDELVTVAEMARRTGRTRESVRLLTEGKRGPGDFPRPITLLGEKQPLWHWSDAAAWFEAYGAIDPATVRDSEFLAALNGALELRRRLPRLDTPDNRRALLDLVTTG
ncbi:MAG TPA: hypothetical protein VFA78_03770 [Chloroflexota bacterium]|nr:hypothetical protein [Chloroflexota bacterium]